MAWWARLCAAWVQLGAIFPYWLFVDFGIQMLMGRIAFGDIFGPLFPAPLMPRVLVPVMGLIIAALIYVVARRRSPFLASHAKQAFVLGALLLIMQYSGDFLQERVGRAYAGSSGVLECATGPGCAVESVIEGGFSLVGLLLRAIGFVGIGVALAGSAFKYPRIGGFFTR